MYVSQDPTNKDDNIHDILIPQRTVDNNLGPDCLEGSKALDPNYCRQPTL